MKQLCNPCDKRNQKSILGNLSWVFLTSVFFQFSSRLKHQGVCGRRCAGLCGCGWNGVAEAGMRKGPPDRQFGPGGFGQGSRKSWLQLEQVEEWKEGQHLSSLWTSIHVPPEALCLCSFLFACLMVQEMGPWALAILRTCRTTELHLQLLYPFQIWTSGNSNSLKFETMSKCSCPHPIPASLHSPALSPGSSRKAFTGGQLRVESPPTHRRGYDSLGAFRTLALYRGTSIQSSHRPMGRGFLHLPSQETEAQ